MSKLGLRIQKSRSMMLSLYSLSFFTFSLVVIIIGSLWTYPIIFSSVQDFPLAITLFSQTLFVVGGGLLICLPFACSLTYLSVVWDKTRRAPFFYGLLHVIEQTPLILYGLIFVLFFGQSTLVLMFLFSFVAVSFLSVRWSQLSKQVKVIEIEAMQSLGLNVWQIIYRLYLRRYMKDYFKHFIIVLCELLLITTPVLLFMEMEPDSSRLLSLEVLKNILLHQNSMEIVVLFLLCIHFIRFLVDQNASYREADIG